MDRELKTGRTLHSCLLQFSYCDWLELDAWQESYKRSATSSFLNTYLRPGSSATVFQHHYRYLASSCALVATPRQHATTTAASTTPERPPGDKPGIPTTSAQAAKAAEAQTHSVSAHCPSHSRRCKLTRQKVRPRRHLRSHRWQAVQTLHSLNQCIHWPLRHP